MKLCGRCKENLSETNFHKKRQAKDGLHTYCKTCRKLIQRAYKNKFREKETKRQRLYDLHRKYNLTETDYNNLLLSQNNKCAICNTEFDIYYIHIDHCHTSGKVRGALCAPCNRGLGQFMDNIDTLYKAAKYLEKYQDA